MYREEEVKYGRKTKAVIDSLTGENIGDQVYNTDNKIRETWNGTIWTNDYSITGIAGEALLEGQAVHIEDVSGNPKVKLASTGQNHAFLGLVVRGGASIGDEVVVAYKGKWKAYFEETTTHGNYFALTSSSGIVEDDGTNSAASYFTTGVILENNNYIASPLLSYVWISGVER